jgi:hypothetical protein
MLQAPYARRGVVTDLGQVLTQVRERIVRYRDLAVGEQDTKAALIDSALRAAATPLLLDGQI